MATTPRPSTKTPAAAAPGRKRTTKKRAAKKATRKKRASKKAGGQKTREQTVAWAAKHMRKNPEVTMAELKTLGRPEGYNVYPLIIGLALKKLGKPGARRGGTGKKRGRKKAVRKKTARRGPGRPRRSPGRLAGRRGPGRPRKVTDPGDALRAVMDRMRDLERETEAMSKALGRIAEIATNY